MKFILMPFIAIYHVVSAVMSAPGKIFQNIEDKAFEAKDKKQKLTLYDLEGNYLDDIYGDNIEVFGDYLIVDKSIYKIELKEN